MRMFKRKSIAAVLLSTVALTASAGSAGAVPAQSAPATWTVPVKGTAWVESVGFEVHLPASGAVISCDYIYGEATAARGTGLSGTGLVTIDFVSWQDQYGGRCHGPFSSTMSVVVSGIPWKFNAVSYDKATATVTGTITGINATVSGPGCSATIAGPDGAPGEVNATYDNSTALLTVRGGEKSVASSVSGCLGLITDGALVDPRIELMVTPRGIITSP